MTITQIQCLLTYLGYSPGTIDGIEGRNTQAAIQDFKSVSAGLSTGISCGHSVGQLTE